MTEDAPTDPSHAPSEPETAPTEEPTVPLPGSAVEAAPSAPISASAEAVGPVPSSSMAAPYRGGYDEVVVARPEPRPSPTFGSGLWIFGVALWAFLVMGQMATTVGPGKHDFLLSEGVAGLFVATAALAAWATALRRTLIDWPARNAFAATMRGVAMVFLAVVTWLVVTVLATAVGKASSKNLDGWITVLLLGLAGAAAAGGRRLAGFHRAGTPPMGTVSRALWVGAGILTMVALLLLLGGA
jgi:hypothetical protein